MEVGGTKPLEADPTAEPETFVGLGTGAILPETGFEVLMARPAISVPGGIVWKRCRFVV
jgi:hypothetical protein